MNRAKREVEPRPPVFRASSGRPGSQRLRRSGRTRIALQGQRWSTVTPLQVPGQPVPLSRPGA